MKGDDFVIRNATFPPGERELLFSIRDKEGNETVRSVMFRIE